jgi:DNA-binding transcriptional LysR family regulator
LGKTCRRVSAFRSQAAIERGSETGLFAMRIDKIDMKKLRAFQLVAKNGSLRTAANQLGQSIPAISAKIRQLEQDFGVALFERLPNKMILTSTGERFVREVDELFEKAEQAIESLVSQRPAGHITVSIGTDHSRYFAPGVSRFVSKHSEVELSLQLHRSSEALQALQNGQVDIAIGIFRELPSGIEQTLLREASVSLLFPKGHPVGQGRPPSLRDIASQRLILLARHSETRRIVDEGFARASLELRRVIEVENCGAAALFVEQGAGIALVHSLSLSTDKASLLRATDIGRFFEKIEFSAIYRKGALRSGINRGLINELTRPD